MSFYEEYIDPEKLNRTLRSYRSEKVDRRRIYRYEEVDEGQLLLFLKKGAVKGNNKKLDLSLFVELPDTYQLVVSTNEGKGERKRYRKTEAYYSSLYGEKEGFVPTFVHQGVIYSHFIPDEDLESYILRGFKPHDTKLFDLVAKDISKALKQMEDDEVMHFDVRSSNVLLDLEQKKAYLTDFGLAHHFSERFDEYCDVRLPPEFFRWYDANFNDRDKEKAEKIYQTMRDKVDAWGLGCVLYRAWTGYQTPWYFSWIEDDLPRYIYQITHLECLEDLPPGWRGSLILNLLNPNPLKRFNCRTAYQFIINHN